jgi:hypothetical protein
MQQLKSCPRGFGTVNIFTIVPPPIDDAVIMPNISGSSDEIIQDRHALLGVSIINS